jgi:hypothetical protein
VKVSLAVVRKMEKEDGTVVVRVVKPPELLLFHTNK